MSRARNIKPGFFRSEALAEIDPLGRLLFSGLWCEADREGRLEDRPKRIKVQILPYDDCNIEDLLNALQNKGFLIRYEINGIRCLQIVNFLKHQDPHYKERASELPPPPGHKDSGITPGGVSEEVRQEIFDRDGRKCVLCAAIEDLSLDHIIARSKGGSHEKDNLRTLCRRCNSSKNNRIAKPTIDQSLADDKSIIDLSSDDDAADVGPNDGHKTPPGGVLYPLIPSSLIPDSGFPSKESPKYGEGFEEFWRLYPKRKAKAAAEKAWKKAKPTEATRSIILAAISKQIDSEDWRKESGQFIPYPATWINGRQWEDEITSKSNGSYQIPDYAKGAI